MRVVDLFCGAGGASEGYRRAGFDVSGVDILDHSDYPFELTVMNALDWLKEPEKDVDIIHASPPCQAYTTMSNRWRGKGGVADSHEELITETRELLIQWGGTYVIENVPGAKRYLRNPVTVTGGFFGLKVHRPRLFESNFPLVGAVSPSPDGVIGVYGALDGRRLYSRKDGTTQYAAQSIAQARQAMGIDWMSWEDLTEAIPPAYTEFIGGQLAAAW